MYAAIKLTGDTNDFDKGGFLTEDDAWDYVSQFICELCRNSYEVGMSACEAEWDVITQEEYEEENN